MKKQLLIIVLFINCTICDAQIDLQCNGRDMHSIYLVHFSIGFYRIDSVDTHPTQPVFIANDAISIKGISINNNLYTGSGVETMYGCDQNGQYFYYDTTVSNWVSTMQYSGSSNTVNPGGTDNYIFNYDPLLSAVYRYDGTANGTPLITGLPPTTRLADIAVDNQGNFYLFDVIGNKITAYNPSGIPIDSFITTGNSSNGGGGFAILGSRIYFTDLSSPREYLYEGIKTGNTINFSVIDTLPAGFISYDLAACPNAGNPLAVLNNITAPRYNIYPNPFTDKLNISASNNELSEMIIYDIASRKLLKQKFTNSVSLNTEQLEKGIYLYEVRCRSGLCKKGKLVKD